MRSCTRSAPARALGLGALIALALSGCTNPAGNEPPAEGSWVEVRAAEVTEIGLLVEEAAGFRSVDVQADRLVFEFDGSSPLQVGQVVGGDLDGGYLRHIDALRELSDGSIEATTSPARIADLFADLQFVLHYRPMRAEERAPREGVVEAALEGDCNDVEPCDLAGGRGFGAEDPICTVGYGEGLDIAPFVETDLSGEMEFELNGLTNPTVAFALDGSLRAGVRVSADAAASLSCAADFAALLALPEVVLLRITVYGIPLTISAAPVLSGAFEASIDAGGVSAEAGAEASASLRFGVVDGDAIAEQTFEFEPFAEVTTTRAGALSAHGELTAGVKLKLTIGGEIDLAVASVQAELWGAAALTGTLGIDLTADAAGCAWTVDVPWSCDLGLTVGGALGASFFGWDVNWPFEAGPWSFVLAEGSLGSLGGELPWCGGSELCDPTAPSCFDDYLDNEVCDGRMGFRECAGGTVQHCLCTADGWTDCSACM